MVAVKDIRVEVDTVGPHDAPGHLVKGYTGELRGIPQGVEHLALKQTFEVELPDQAVGERELETKAAERLDLNNSCRSGHDATLPEGFNWHEGVGYLCTLPIGLQLITS